MPGTGDWLMISPAGTVALLAVVLGAEHQAGELELGRGCSDRVSHDVRCQHPGIALVTGGNNQTTRRPVTKFDARDVSKSRELRAFLP